MNRGVPYTAAEDDALTKLYRLHRANWERHVCDFPALAGRSVGSLKFRIYKSLGLGVLIKSSLAPVTVLKDWPAPGTVLFADDSRAVRDHGSARRLGLPPLRSSGCSSSASWVVGGRS